ISSYSLKFHRLTIATSASGTRKNSRNTSANGAACHHALTAWTDGLGACALAVGALTGSGGDELVPLSDHVLVLVHHRVPAGNAAHALLVAAAVAHRAGLGDHVAVRALDVLRGGLAFHP